METETTELAEKIVDNLKELKVDVEVTLYEGKGSTSNPGLFIQADVNVNNKQVITGVFSDEVSKKVEELEDFSDEEKSFIENSIDEAMSTACEEFFITRQFSYTMK